MKKNLLSFSLLGLSFLSPFETLVPTVPVAVAEKSLDLTVRYPDPWVNEVFRDNILLTLHYLAGDIEEKPDWEKVRQPFEVSFTLNPGEVFAFHEDVLLEFEGKVVKTTGAHFNWQDGFKSDGWLIGDGVCHLASLMNWVASEAGLRVVAHVNHDFLPVPGVPKEYGTSIFWSPSGGWRSQRQNLYIENTLDFPVKFSFKATADKVNLILSR
jgi:hypothetical protein